ncbi:MAG: DUF2163 domain-containing protein [Thermodesulfobacteriota bacterium]|nr:MAG: DUF2163 domain-containing protein [Thermodesulfobacteriota bacterium]
MKTISPALQTHLEGDNLTLAFCWKITRQDGVTLGFTSNDKDIVYDGVTYEAATGGDRTAISTTSQMNPDQVDLEGLLFDEGDGVLENDLREGKYDYAEIWLFLINFMNTGMGIIKLRRGRFGKVKIEQGKYTASITSMTDYFSKKMCEAYSAECRADLGDSRCGVNLTALKVTGAVTGVTDNRVFADSSRTEANDYFNYGYIHWLTGDNAGLSMEVKDWGLSTTTFTLFLAMPKTIQIGDTYEAYPGCDKKVSTCEDKYDNVINFRGEPFVPPESVINQSPDAED